MLHTVKQMGMEAEREVVQTALTSSSSPIAILLIMFLLFRGDKMNNWIE